MNTKREGLGAWQKCVFGTHRLGWEAHPGEHIGCGEQLLVGGRDRDLPIRGDEHVHGRGAGLQWDNIRGGRGWCVHVCAYVRVGGWVGGGGLGRHKTTAHASNAKDRREIKKEQQGYLPVDANPTPPLSSATGHPVLLRNTHMRKSLANTQQGQHIFLTSRLDKARLEHTHKRPGIETTRTVPVKTSDSPHDWGQPG